MKLEGVHHITAITGDAQKNVDFYVGVLGLRLVKKTVNQDDPTVYHLFYADEKGDAGSDLTFFEYPGAPQGRAGDGMIWGSAGGSGAPRPWTSGRSGWTESGIEAELDERQPCGSPTPRVSAMRCKVVETEDEPLIAEHPEIPAEVALQGFDGAIALREQSRGEPAAARGGSRLRAAGGRAGQRLGGAAGTAGAASGATPSLPPSAGCRGREASTTSPGHRRWTITRPGATG